MGSDCTVPDHCLSFYFTQLPSREKDEYLNTVKSHQIIQFLVLKLKKK